ncbi:D-alanyl-D-alanine carboxypeptidase [Streptomyces sp. NPDC002676]
MAGESPDSSKQRESSAEPTSGSAVPVPEARDPRLAMSRERDTAAAKADTATKILSVHPPKPIPASTEDTDLREAVSAWVRTARPNQGAEETAEAGVEDTAGPEAESDTEANAEGGTEAEAEGGTGAEAEGTAAAKADGTAAAEAEGVSGAEAEGDADAEAEETAEAEDEETAEAEDEETAEAEDEETAEAEDEAATEAGTDADAKADAGAEAEAEGDAEAKAEDAPEAKAGDEAGAKAEEIAEAEAEASAEADADAKTDAEAKAGADAEAEADKGVAEAEVGDGEAEAEASGDEPEAADGEDAPQGPPAADNEARTGGAGGNKDAEGEAEAKTDDGEAEAKASGDEPEDAEGEAEAKASGAQGGAKGIDQPTTAFKALRPKKPGVDQPTTMLKVDRAPKAPKSTDPERTSKFVALKPDVTTNLPQVGPERTTQQPLPPRPPLDLLAELTNTPPPPQTPVRTLIRRVKIWTPLVILLAIIFAVVQTLRPLPQPTLDLTAKDTYTFDGAKTDIPWPSQGQAALDVQGIGTFGSSGDQKPVPIASVAKVMTAYLILSNHPLKSGAEGPKIKIDQPAEDQSIAGHESTVHVTKGDSITQREALEGILIASANNVARLLARWDAGSEQAFVAKMNAAAKKLGMTNTTYTDPSGLTNSTVSTAVDQVKLAKAAMTLPAFREVAAMMSYTDYKGAYHSNWNQLVGHNNVVGIKTGTTTSALGNLVFAAKQQTGGETRIIVGAVLRQPAGGPEHTILSAALDGSDKLIRAAQGALKSATILKKGDVVGYVDDGLGGRTPVVVTQDVTAAGWAGLKVKLSFAADHVPHTAKAGTKVGTLTVGDGSASAVKVPVALKQALTEPGFAAKLTRLG